MSRPKIATVTVNPAVDVRYTLSHLMTGEVNRVSSVSKTAGGKGLNVTRVLSTLGHEVVCTGFLGGKNGDWIKTQLSLLNAKPHFISVEAETRSCLAILTEEGQTEILEPGPVIKRDEIECFHRAFDFILDTADVIVVSGSLPQGMPTDFYRGLSEKVNQKGARLLLDTSGPALAQSMAGKPFLIKPNREEFADLVGREIESDHDMLKEAQGICQKGIQYVLLSLGGEGAYLISEKIILRARIPEIQVVNPVGSGDSMLAGFAHAHSHGYHIEEVLKWACACGMSNAMLEETGTINLDHIRQLVEEIEVTEEKGGM